MAAHVHVESKDASANIRFDDWDQGSTQRNAVRVAL
jgi:hypothetical protein